MIQTLEDCPRVPVPTAGTQDAPLDCPGCEWLRTDARERRRLAAELSRIGDRRLAETAEESIDGLARDWQAHIRRDHPEGAACLLALRPALQAATPMVERV